MCYSPSVYSRETPPLQYFNHVSNCSVQGETGTKPLKQDVQLSTIAMYTSQTFVSCHLGDQMLCTQLLYDTYS